MNRLEEFPDKRLRKSPPSSLGQYILCQALPTTRLEDGDAMILFVAADLPADVHPGGEKGQQLLVDGVDAGAKRFDSFPVIRCIGIRRPLLQSAEEAAEPLR